MSKPIKIDFVSDVACPWCAVGLYSLEQALVTLRGELDVRIHLQPFELNPQMGPEGQDLTEHLVEKYGSTPEQLAKVRETLNRRGREAGFAFKPEGRGRVWNTFALHRLLHWAAVEGQPGQALALKKAFLQAYHGRAEDMTSPLVVLTACEAVGLDRERAAEVLEQGLFADEVRERETFFMQAGIRSVPATIVNDRHLISGGHPAEVFVQALRQIASEIAPDTATGGASDPRPGSGD